MKNTMTHHSDVIGKNVTKAFSVAMLLETILSEDIDMDKEILHGAAWTISDLLGEIEEAEAEQRMWELEKQKRISAQKNTVTDGM